MGKEKGNGSGFCNPSECIAAEQPAVHRICPGEPHGCFRTAERIWVKMHFSGHSHIQHSGTEGSLTDVAVGSLTVAPLRYGLIKIDEERRVSYEPASLGILRGGSRGIF